MVQIFAYFKYIQIVRTLEPTKVFARVYEITQFYIAWQLFIYFGAPDVPVNM